MKNILFLLICFLLATQCAHAQREIVKDTLFFDTQGDQLYVNGYREFDDGSRQPVPALAPHFRLPVTDTSQAVQLFINQSRNIADEYSNAVVTTPRLGVTNKTITDLHATIQILFGASIRDSIQNSYKPDFLTFQDTTEVNSWTLFTGAASQSVKFVEAGAQRVLRLELANGTRLPVVIFSSRWFRVLNLDGANREFHLMPNGIYAVLNESGRVIYRLRNTRLIQVLRK